MNNVQPGFRALALPLGQLSLGAVLKCGQSFRWSIYPLSLPTEPLNPAKPSHEYRFCLRDRVVCLRQTSDTLFFKSIFPETPENIEEKEAETLVWLQDYFQLDVDLLKLYDDWSGRDQVFAKLRDRFEGLRMLRQDPWENLISFICSSNNNIARITKMIKALCTYFSPQLMSIPPPSPVADVLSSTPYVAGGLATEEELEPYHPFPPPSRLADPSVSSTLRSLGFGYRADFIQKTAAMLVDERSGASLNGTGEAPELWLKTLRKATTAEARGELIKFMGVGRKVADCVLLMSLDKREVIPVDTHVHQIAIKHYGFRGSLSSKQALSPKLYEEINAKLVEIWGEYAGWAQTVLFTADLKSFSTYGLPTPSPTPAITAPATPTEETPLLLPTTLSKKRKRAIPNLERGLDGPSPSGSDTTVESVSLASRAKKARRRTATTG